MDPGAMGVKTGREIYVKPTLSRVLWPHVVVLGENGRDSGPFLLNSPSPSEGAGRRGRRDRSALRAAWLPSSAQHAGSWAGPRDGVEMEPSLGALRALRGHGLLAPRRVPWKP